MAIFKVSMGESKNLPSTYEEGRLYFTKDDGKIYIDISNEENGRILINSGKADKLTVDDGSTSQPVFFKNGIPIPIDYKIETSVPKNAVFTDTTYDVATTESDGLMSSIDKQKIDNLSKKNGILFIGEYKYDGSKDVTIPSFDGTGEQN